MGNGHLCGEQGQLRRPDLVQRQHRRNLRPGLRSPRDQCRPLITNRHEHSSRQPPKDLRHGPLSLVIVVRWGFLRSRRERLFQGLETARERWIDRLRNQALLPFILQTLNDLARGSALYATSLNPDIPPRLVERSEPRRLVASEAMDRIRAITESMREGSLGVSGPRGAGKTTIVRYFCDDAYRATGEGTAPGAEVRGAVPPPGEPELRVVLSAPVDYQPRDFILHLFLRLAETVLDSTLARQPEERRAIARRRWPALPGTRGWRGLTLTSSAARQVPMEDRSRRLLADLRYLQTYSTNW